MSHFALVPLYCPCPCIPQAPCGGIPAAHMTSATPATLIKQIYKDLGRADRGREPSIKLLYVTPERLGNSDSLLDFMHRLHEQVGTVGAGRYRTRSLSCLFPCEDGYVCSLCHCRCLVMRL